MYRYAKEVDTLYHSTAGRRSSNHSLDLGVVKLRQGPDRYKSPVIICCYLDLVGMRGSRKAMSLVDLPSFLTRLPIPYRFDCHRPRSSNRSPLCQAENKHYKNTHIAALSRILGFCSDNQHNQTF